MSTMVNTVVTAASRRDRKKAAEKPTCEGMARTAYSENWPASFWSENLSPA